MQGDKQTHLLSACMLALCGLHALLHPASPGEAHELGKCVSLLADCNALRDLDSLFLKQCLKRLLQCPHQLFDSSPGETVIRCPGDRGRATIVLQASGEASSAMPMMVPLSMHVDVMHVLNVDLLMCVGNQQL